MKSLALLTLIALCPVSAVASPLFQTCFEPPLEQQAYLKGLGSPENQSFGGVMAASGDTVAVVAQGQEAVYVYQRTGTGWTLQARLTPNPSLPGSAFGESLDIDGDTIVVGAHDYSALTFLGGAVYVYARSGDDWVQEEFLLGTSLAGEFGKGVAVDGDTMVVGSPWDGGTGAIYVFNRTGTTWSEVDRLQPSPPVVGLGWILDIHDGLIAAGQGSVTPYDIFLFRHDLGTWKEDAVILNPTPGSSLSHALSLSGQRLAVGFAGPQSAFVFRREAPGAWVLEAELNASNADQTRLTVSVSVSALPALGYSSDQAAKTARRPV